MNDQIQRARAPVVPSAAEISAFVRTLGIQPGEVDRVIGHWDGGGAYPGPATIRAYNAMVDQFLGLHRGQFSADDNIDTADGIYAAHTLHSNTRAFGLALCGMHGATERPFNPGPTPITEAQFKLSAVLVAFILRAAGLPLAPHTALTHAEVEQVLGIKQKGKWDIAVLPWRTDIVGARAVGNYWRTLIKETLDRLGQPVLPVDPGILKRGNVTPREEVRQLQRDLAELRYFAGKIDGLFGQLTESAVMAVQRDNGLEADGVVGPRTREAILSAAPRPERDVTEADLADSGTIKDARAVRAGAIGLGGAGIVTQALDGANAVGSQIAMAEGWLGTAKALVVEYWPILIFAAGALALIYFADRIKARRVADARSGAHLGR